MKERLWILDKFLVWHITDAIRSVRQPKQLWRSERISGGV